MAEKIIRINDNTIAGKTLLRIAREFAQSYKSISIVDEDKVLGKMMDEGMKTKNVSKKSVFKELM